MKIKILSVALLFADAAQGFAAADDFDWGNPAELFAGSAQGSVVAYDGDLAFFAPAPAASSSADFLGAALIPIAELTDATVFDAQRAGFKNLLELYILKEESANEDPMCQASAEHSKLRKY